MPNASWFITFYRADNDAAVAAYTEVAITTIAAYTNYGISSGVAAIGKTHITAPQKTKLVEGETLTDLNGWEESIFTLRDVFSVQLWPFKFTASATDPDLDNWEELIFWLKGRPKLWARIDAGTRLYPSNVLNVHPISIESVDESVDEDSGVHNVTLNLRVKGLL